MNFCHNHSFQLMDLKPLQTTSVYPILLMLRLSLKSLLRNTFRFLIFLQFDFDRIETRDYPTLNIHHIHCFQNTVIKPPLPTRTHAYLPTQKLRSNSLLSNMGFFLIFFQFDGFFKKQICSTSAEIAALAPSRFPFVACACTLGL